MDSATTDIYTLSLHAALPTAIVVALFSRAPSSEAATPSTQAAFGAVVSHVPPIRSEERRVGKERRSRWSPDHYKKKSAAPSPPRKVSPPPTLSRSLPLEASV